MNSGRLGLVNQPPLTSVLAKQARLVHADLQPEEFHREWKNVRLSLRIGFFVLAPLYGLWQRLFASRESLAKGRAFDDLPSSDEILSWSPDYEAFSKSIGDARDERLIFMLQEEIASSGPEAKHIAIIYGARHMRAIIRHLNGLGFRCGISKWVVVFSL